MSERPIYVVEMSINGGRWQPLPDRDGDAALALCSRRWALAAQKSRATCPPVVFGQAVKYRVRRYGRLA